MPLAQKALNDEWTRLRAVQRPDGKSGCWDVEAVMEWRDVKRAAQVSGTTAHIGRVFATCVEKDSELEPSKRKYKGRAVFGGIRSGMRPAIGPYSKTWGRVPQPWTRPVPVMHTDVYRGTPQSSATQNRHLRKLCCAALRLAPTFHWTNGQTHGPA